MKKQNLKSLNLNKKSISILSSHSVVAGLDSTNGNDPLWTRPYSGLGPCYSIGTCDSEANCEP
jgi:hypothetical protein